MIPFEAVKKQLHAAPRTWLITGVAGFIGSNLLEWLLQGGQDVIGLDDFSTGSRQNLEDVRACVGEDAWRCFTFLEGDTTDPSTCARACAGVEYVLHQAAWGSVPRSLTDPRGSHRANVDGFVNMAVAAKDAQVRRFVYASSSSVYGDHPGMPKREDQIGTPLSPYGVTKVVNEIYAGVFSRVYGLPCVGLRYFNVFGRRQDPDGPYAAVIPRWVSSMLRGKPCVVFGDGATSRDFCYIENAVQANILAATSENPSAVNTVYNVAAGECTTLRDLHAMIRDRMAAYRPELQGMEPAHGPFRPGDIRHSHADIGKARQLLGYHPTHTVAHGLDGTIQWYVESLGAQAERPAATGAAR